MIPRVLPAGLSLVLSGSLAVPVSLSPAPGALAASSPAAVPTATLTTHPLDLGAPVESMVAAGKHLFASTGNAVTVLSGTGEVTTVLTGLSGAAGMAVSPDASTVYVALSGEHTIGVVDTSTLTVDTRWTAERCPTDVALSGTYLVYSHGCEQHGAELSVLDLGTGQAVGRPTEDRFYEPPLLAATGDQVVAGEPGLSPASLTSYTVSAQGLARNTELRTQGSYLNDLAASPTARTVVPTMGSPYDLTTYDATTLASGTVYDAGPYPHAVAFSPDGTLLAGGLDPASGGQLYLYDTTTGQTVLKGTATPADNPDSGNPAVRSQTLTFADADTIHAVLHSSGQDGRQWLMTASTHPPASTSTKLKATSPTTYGRKLVLTATVSPKRSGLTVRFTVSSGGKERTYKARTNSSGRARVSVTARHSGTAEAVFAGSPKYTASADDARFTVPSKLGQKLAGPHRTRKGVAVYRSVKDVQVVTTLAPTASGRGVKAVLRCYYQGSWRPVTSGDFPLDGAGRLWLTVTRMEKGFRYRIDVSFGGDSLNRKSSLRGKPFKVA